MMIAIPNSSSKQKSHPSSFAVGQRALRVRTAVALALLGSTAVGCINRSQIGEILHGGGSGGQPQPMVDGTGGSRMSMGRGGASGRGGGGDPADGGMAVGGETGAAGSGAASAKLDILFMIDDSSSMRPLQDLLAAGLPQFVAALAAAPGGLPDLQLGVISSSLGAGAFTDVPGCGPGSPGDDGGRLLHKAGCGLAAGENFLKVSAGGMPTNFTGELATVLGCVAALGDLGCGFEHQLESTRQALLKAANPMDPDNGGFLRADANLAIVMLTNEDDCSAPADSQLFDTSVASIEDVPALGGLWSYRCNEFGHRCDQPLPHSAAGLPVTLTGCTSRESPDDLYSLTPIGDFEAFLRAVKSDPTKVSVYALMGPTSPYVVTAHLAQLPTGASELQPQIAHACTAGAAVYADPSVRLSELVGSLGARGAVESLCVDDLGPPMTRIASSIARSLQP